MQHVIPQYLRHHARHLSTPANLLADSAVRFGSAETLTLLSLKASQGRCDYAELLMEMRALLESGVVAGTAPVTLQALSGVAWVRSGQPAAGGDFAEAADLYRALRLLRAAGRPSDGPLSPRDSDLLDAQTNLVVGRLDYVRRILPDLRVADEIRWMLETELAHPLFGLPGSTHDQWLDSFNRIFVEAGLSPIGLEPGDSAPFDRLVPAGETQMINAPGPLVSVVMSVFRPDQSLLTALRSIVSQTWPRLQVLVVDDCSPPEYQPLIEDAVAMDDRIELHRMPRNGGTYKIRNFAMGIASGDVITFQDSDDWSHPERIERQLRPLLDDPDLVATLSRSVRVSGRLSTVKVGYPALRRNLSSLMFRGGPVLAALGGFDEVRKSADAEFIDRLELVFGRARVRSLDLPMALVQLTENSLSRSEFLLGWRDGNRVAYRHAFEFWHSLLAKNEAPARLEPGGPRAFPASDAHLGRAVDADRSCDVAIVSDWRDGIQRYVGVDEEARALGRAGHSTVLLHAEAARHALRKRVGSTALTMRLHAAGDVSIAQWTDPLNAGLVVVRDPELMGYPRGGDVRVRAERVIVHAGYQARAPGQDWLVYDPAAVEANVRSMFGVDPVWLPATAEIAAGLKADGALCEVLDPRHLGVVPLHKRPYPGGTGGARAVIGTTGLAARADDRPTKRQLIDLLPDDDHYDVRIRDVAGALDIKRKPRAYPPNWMVTETAGLGELLEQLDVYIGVPLRSWGPERSYEASLAIAHGCVAVLDPSYESQFGEAAMYTRDLSTRRIIDHLRSRPEVHETQQRVGYEWCDRHLSVSAYLEALDLLPTSHPGKRK